MGGAGARRPDGRRRDLERRLGRYALPRDRGWDRPDAVDQSLRGTAGGFRADGRDAFPARFVLAGGGHERRQRDPLQWTYRTRTPPVPRRWTGSRAAAG